MKLSYRLFLLVLLTVAVPVALHVLKEVELRQGREEALRNEALRRVQVTDAELSQVVDSTHQFLATLSQLHSVEANDTSLCSPFFERLQQRSPTYALIAVADRDGRVYCASRSQYLGTEVGDRPYFQEALRTGHFVVGEYTLGRINRRAILPFALPVRDSKGMPHAVVFTSIRLTWLAAYLRKSGIPRAAMLTVADSDGTILAQVPDRENATGQRLEEPYRSLLRAGKEGVAETKANGSEVIVGYSPLAAPPRNLFAAVSFEKSAYFAPIARDTLRDIAGILLATSLALLAAWVIAARFVGRPIRHLVEVGRRWHEGDYTARANFADRTSEIGQLGAVFDELAEKLHVRERQLRTAADAKRRLLAAAGHDLRQPLQVLTLAMAKLGRRASTAAEHRDVARAEKALDKLSSAFDMLVDASRLDSGLQVRLRRFPINDLLDDVRDEWLPVAEEKGLRLRTVACPVVVESDREMLGTIVHNLVGNALKYTERGGVVVGCRRRRGTLSIEVVDTGIGIPKDKLGLIFNEFAQLDPTHAGVGLGLAIVQGTAEILGHPVHVFSNPGKGSRFAVEVPMASASAMDRAEDEGPSPTL